MRPTQTWILFGVCLAVVLAAMALVSYTAVRLDRQGREHATREENVRLALWRMECALGPLIAQESGRPYFWYRPFYPATRAYTRMYAEIKQGEVLVPSPLLTQLPAYVLLHFQIDRGGEITSPQAPTGNDRDLAEAAYTTNEKVTASTARLLELKSVVSKETLAGALGEDVYQLDLLADHRPFPPRDIALRNSEEQGIRNTLEWQARASQQAVLWSNVTSNVDFPFADVKEKLVEILEMWR